MLEAVREIWIKGVLEQSLYNVARLELGLTTQPDAVQDVWQVIVQRPDQPQRRLSSGIRISTVFDELGRGLLILGAPGSGKTTLLLELTHDLLDRAEGHPNHPIPVVFNLSSWAVRQAPLDDWLVDELSERYQVPRKHATSWVAKDLILPLLDGLDEVALGCRSNCAEAINIFRKEHGLTPVAVCSRVADYEALTIRLQLTGAVRVQSLTREQTRDYLAQAGARLVGVQAALHDDEILWELFDTPLMLSIAALAYQGRSAAELQTSGTLEERKTLLFAAYTDAMFKRRGKMLLYSSQQTIQWLAWLAFAMASHNQSMFYLEWMQPNWLSSKWQQKIVSLGAIVLSGLIGGLVGVLVGSVFSRPHFGQYLGLGMALSGALFGLVNVLWKRNTERNLEIQPIETVRWVWAKARENWVSRLKNGILVGGLVGALLMVGFYWFDGPKESLVGYVIFGAVLVCPVCALVNILIGGLVTSDITTRVIPNEGIRRSLRNSLLLTFFSMLIGGLIGVLISGGITISLGIVHQAHLLFAVMFGAAVGVVVGLFVGLRTGGTACFQHLILRLLLWRNGFSPWHYVCFLDYATERVFLRRVGGGYIFIHRMLLEYFAGLHLIDKKPRVVDNKLI